jgi:transcriptional regulator with XRE-family HTH domain
MNAIEGGATDPRASRIVAIAQVLGVSTDALLLGTAATAKRTARREGALMPDDHEERLRQQEHFQDALAALVAAAQWTPVPLTDDTGQVRQALYHTPGYARAARAVACALLSPQYRRAGL